MNKRFGTSVAPTRNGSKSGNKEFITINSNHSSHPAPQPFTQVSNSSLRFRSTLFTRSDVWEFLKPKKTINHKDVNNCLGPRFTQHSCRFHACSPLWKIVGTLRTVSAEQRGTTTCPHHTHPIHNAPTMFVEKKNLPALKSPIWNFKSKVSRQARLTSTPAAGNFPLCPTGSTFYRVVTK